MTPESRRKAIKSAEIVTPLAGRKEWIEHLSHMQHVDQPERDYQKNGQADKGDDRV